MADYNLGTARGKIELDSSGVTTGAAQANSAVAGMGVGMDRASGTLIKTGAVFGGVGLAAVAGFGIAVNAAANFEQRISAIGAVTGAAGKDLEELRGLALKLGADTKFSAGEAAGAIEELAKAGIPLKDILGGAASAVTDLAAAGEVDLVNAASITTNAMNAFGIQGKDAAHIADVFASAANASAADVDVLGQSLQQVSAVASLVGLSFEDTVNALAQFADRGLKGSDAGTSLKTALLSLQPQTDKQKKLFDELGITTNGLSNKFFDQTGKLRPLVEIQKVLQDATAGMTQQQKLATLEQIGGTDAIRALGILTEGTTQKTEEFSATLNRTGSAQEVAKKKQDNLKGSIEQLKGSFETMMISFGSAAQGPIRAIADALKDLADWFTNLSPEVQDIIVKVGLAVAAFALLSGGFLVTAGFGLKMVKTVQELNTTFKLLSQQTGVSKLITAVRNAIIGQTAASVAGVPALGGLAVAEGAEGVAAGVATAPTVSLAAAIWAVLAPVLAVVAGVLLAVGVFLLLTKVLGVDTKNALLIILSMLFPFIGIPLLIINNWSKIAGFFSGLWNTVWGFFSSFFSKIPGWISGLANIIITFLSSLPGLAAQWISSFVQTVLSFLATLPERVGFLLGLIIGTAIRWSVELIAWGIQAGIGFITAVLNFLIELPGRILDLLVTIISHVAQWYLDFVRWAIEAGTGFVAGVVDFLVNLPGRVAGFLAEVISHALNLATKIPGIARDAASGFFNAIIDGIKGLPGMVGEVINNVIEAFKGVVGRAFNAAKDFASGLWNGFKEGIFGSPYTKIEYAMWTMVDNVTQSVKDLNNQLGKIDSVGDGSFALAMKTANDVQHSVDLAGGRSLPTTASRISNSKTFEINFQPTPSTLDEEQVMNVVTKLELLYG